MGSLQASLKGLVPVTLVVPESEDERRQRLKEAEKDASEKRLHGRVMMLMMSVTWLTLLVLVAYMAVKGNADQQKLGLDGG